jgi:glyoxylase-like metal-dependent hydrolase (beta-lactamase superfamily II)
MVGPPPASWDVDPARARAFLLAPGVWQLRLPLPWATTPHVNAYLFDEPDGPLLVDCGSAGHPSLQEGLAVALGLAGVGVADIRTLVATHMHSDHIGLVRWIVDESHCTFRGHPNTAHFYDALNDPDRIRVARTRRALQEGVPAAEVGPYGDVREEILGAMAVVEPEPLLDGDHVGPWRVLETPGHAQSHVCLIDADRSIIVLGDLLAPRFIPWFEYGYSEDPVAELLHSLDRVEALGSFDLALVGHGRPLEDVPAAIAGYREGIAERLEATAQAVGEGPAGAYVLAERVLGAQPPLTAVFALTEVASYLRHLRLAGVVRRDEDGDGRFLYTLT